MRTLIGWCSDWRYLLHEALAQADDLGEEDGVVGQVRAQVAQHGDDITGQLLEGLHPPRGLTVLQGLPMASFGTFGDPSPEITRTQKQWLLL